MTVAEPPPNRATPKAAPEAAPEDRTAVEHHAAVEPHSPMEGWTRPPEAARWPGNAEALARDLRRAVEGPVRFDRGHRALYATDASNYRQVPIGVVLPKSAADVEAAFGSAAATAPRRSPAAAAPASPASAATSPSSSTSAAS